MPFHMPFHQPAPVVLRVGHVAAAAGIDDDEEEADPVLPDESDSVPVVFDAVRPASAMAIITNRTAMIL
jgi:hypothetical protein